MAGHCCTNKQRTISLRRANHLNKTIRGLFNRQYFTLLDYTQLTEGSTTKQHSSIYYLQLDSPTQSHSLQDQEGSMGWMGEGIGRDERYRSDYVMVKDQQREDLSFIHLLHPFLVVLTILSLSSSPTFPFSVSHSFSLSTKYIKEG